jgi:hypothetical protein
MIKTKNQPETFVEGRGGGRGLPLTDAEVMGREDEVQIDPFPAQNGAEAQDYGNDPITVKNDKTGFHTGRGPGRGHGPETK